MALLLTFQYISQREKALGLMAEPVPVLVAKQDLPRLTRLDEAVVEVRQVPRQYLQPGALAAVKEAHNQVTNTPMLKGEQVLGTKLVAYGVETGLAIKVPKGLRGVTLSVNDVSGLAEVICEAHLQDPTALNLRGTIQLRLDRPAQARQDFLAAIQAGPGHAQAHYNLGGVCAGHFKDTACAREAFQRYLELEPS